ncbi:hypothetical protein F5Y15DRAFT_403323 [Xylariaceae sp. FL0016]|nr:hypothetical protein F5Y15DRAFT_403323 [Xylariaceae sp. FL0016]
MSLSPGKPSQQTADDAVSREDFELLQRFLRVARLLQLQDTSIDPTLAQTTQGLETDRCIQGSRRVAGTSSIISQPPEVNHDAYADGLDEDDNDDDYECEDDGDDAYELRTRRSVPTQRSGHLQRCSRSMNTRASTYRRRHAPQLVQQQRAEEEPHQCQEQQQQQQEQRYQQQQQLGQVRQQDERLWEQQPQEISQRQLRSPQLNDPNRSGERRLGSGDRLRRPHAAVEKRYRSVLNGRIQQLSESIPSSNAFSTDDAPGDNTAPSKADTKAVVLDRAIQYINNLVATYERYESEQEMLQGKLQLWLDETAPSPVEIANAVQP